LTKRQCAELSNRRCYKMSSRQIVDVIKCRTVVKLILSSLSTLLAF
jgi:hypothetical protein